MTDDIQRALGRLEGQNAAIIKMLEDNKNDHEKMAIRVNILESRVNWAAGIGAAAIFVFPVVLHILGLK